MASIRIQSSVGSYDVVCARGLLARVAPLTARLSDSTGTYFLSSPRVWNLWGRKVSADVLRRGKPSVILFEDSETAKRLATVEEITRKLIRAGADRHATLVAVGGGVVGDVAGFVAASYMRGVRLVHVPTTLVAQVDSSIGGKTGVNLPEGKNLVGAFYPPRLVVADPDVLRTLPHRELRSGLYEVVKYGIIADRNLFEYLERHMEALVRRDPKALSQVIERSTRIKARIVSKDERESGLRQILNFGHTLGHVLEAATGYRRFVHGEAIGWGMLAVTLLGLAKNQIRENDAGRIIRLIMSIGPLPSLAGIDARDLREIILGDKKSRGGHVLWVLPEGIGKVSTGREVPWPLVARTFAELPTVATKARR
jgi:3-dehydroquinate synthase